MAGQRFLVDFATLDEAAATSNTTAAEFDDQRATYKNQWAALTGGGYTGMSSGGAGTFTDIAGTTALGETVESIGRESDLHSQDVQRYGQAALICRDEAAQCVATVSNLLSSA